MKKLAFLFSASVIVAATTLSSCKKDKKDDDNNNNNTGNTNPPSVTASMNSTNQGNVESVLDVSRSTGTAKMILDVKSMTNIDKIYITKSEDNGSSTSQTMSNITSSAGLTFTGSSTTYSYDAPDNADTFKLEIPISLRSSSSASSDVYQVWMTSGDGSFLLPFKNRILGTAKIVFRYSSSASSTSYSTSDITLGDQTSNVGNWLVTSGMISVVSSASYNESPESIEISLSSLNSVGVTKQDGSSYQFFVSPDIRTTLGYTSEPSNTNTTVFEEYAGDFAAATGDEMKNMAVAANSKIQITANHVYKYMTETGKKGLIKVKSIHYETDVDAGATIEATVKSVN